MQRLDRQWVVQSGVPERDSGWRLKIGVNVQMVFKAIRLPEVTEGGSCI